MDNCMCCNLQPFLKAIDIVITVLKIGLPIFLIVLGTIDMFKAMITDDDKVVIEARKNLVRRIMYGILIFLVPYFIELILKFTETYFMKSDNMDLTSPTSWVECWNDLGTDDHCGVCENIYE